MIDWVRRLFAKGHAPLAGAPTAPRIKTYSAMSGYAYQYSYLGRRNEEYLFQVSWDRKIYIPVAVVLGATALETWQNNRSRELSDKERYAVAKLALRQAFDERTPEQMRKPVTVRPADIDLIAETLGLL